MVRVARRVSTASSTLVAVARSARIDPLEPTRAASSSGRVVDPRRVHLRTARSLEARLGREPADECDRLARLAAERQHAAVVLSSTAERRAASRARRVVGVHVEVRRAAAGAICRPARAPGGRRGRAARSVSSPDPIAATTARSLRPRLGGISRSSPARSAATRSCTAPQSLTTSPANPHSSRSTWLSSQCVLRGVRPVDLVVGAHHRPRLRVLHHVLERGQVDLAQGAFVHLGADPQPVGLLVVRGEVLQRGADTPALHAVDHRGREHAGQPRILGEVLEVAPAQRRSLHVDARAEHHRHAAGAAPRPPAPRPTSAKISGSHDDASADAVGKQVAGSDPPSPT